MQPILTRLKRDVSKLCDRFSEALQCVNKNVSNIRVKIVGINSFDLDGANTCLESRFFSIQHQEENREFVKFFYQMIANGSGCCADTLTALSLAVQSDWVQTGDKRRHIIVLFTDAPAYKLEDANRSNPYYPENMPASLVELSDIWMTPASGQTSKIKLQQPAKRLIVFAPQMYPWPEIYESWNQVIYNPSKAGEGLDDVSYEDIINACAGSI